MSRKTALRSCMLIYNIIFWLSGCVLIFLGLWMILDPRRNYILDLVDFSEDDPLLRFAAYIAIISGIGTIFIGFMSCCGAIQAERCMILTFIIFILLLFFSELTIGVLGVIYKEKIISMQYKVHMKYLINKKYGINKDNYQNYKITELIDKIQLNLGCCGIDNRDDWNMTEWRKNQSNQINKNLTYFDSQSWRSHKIKRRISSRMFLVPISCCKGRTHILSQFVPLSYMRCQSSSNSNWVYTMGCHKKLKEWFDEQSIIFMGIGFSFAGLQMIGLIIATVLWHNLDDYRFIQA